MDAAPLEPSTTDHHELIRRVADIVCNTGALLITGAEVFITTIRAAACRVDGNIYR